MLGIDWLREGKFKYLILENGEKIKWKDLRKPFFEIECQKCGKMSCINFYNQLYRRDYICQSCNTIGRIQPPRTEEYKKRMSEARKGWYVGEKNPFYGRQHTEETKKLLSLKNKGKRTGSEAPFYGRRHPDHVIKEATRKRLITQNNWSDEKKAEHSKKISDSHKKLREQNEEKYLNSKRKAGRISQMSVKRYAKNGLETRVHEKLIEMGIEMDYCVILGYHQFDFGNKECRILLEVQGDYWHGNPELYEEQKLNHIQIKNKENDKIKKGFAEKNNLKLFYLWEKDFNDGNFKILEDIKNEIQISKTRNQEITL